MRRVVPRLLGILVLGGCWSARNVCGDGVVLVGLEACDEGAANGDTAACTSTCDLAVCGDGLMWAGTEACDDGAANGDTSACTSTCELAACGDGLVWAGVEACDDGNAGRDDGCSPSCALPLRLDLADASARLIGASPDDRAGFSIEGAGDVDGDGFGDLLVGAPGVGIGGDSAGAAYLVRGPVTGDFDLADAIATLVGEEAFDQAGFSVAGLGDLDGDGFDDLAVGAPYNDRRESAAGSIHILYGPVSGEVDLATADGIWIGQAASDRAGWSLGAPGDTDGDGFADLMIASVFEGQGGVEAGAVYLVRGPVVGDGELDDADAKLYGEAAGDRAGFSASGAGDVDGDGLGDLLVGALYHDQGGVDAGAVYVVYAPVAGVIPLASADAKRIGVVADQGAGFSLDGAGDVDGDGLDDVLIGAVRDAEGGIGAGAAYLVHGPVVGSTDLSTADAKIVGEAADDDAGNSVAGAGDVDGDGFDDVVVGANNVSRAGAGAGAVYLVHGPVVGHVGLEDAELGWFGEGADDDAGVWVAGLGDVDGDGLPDWGVGADGNDAGGPDAGAAYVILGGL